MKTKQILLLVILGGWLCWTATVPAVAAAVSASKSKIPSLDPIAALHLDITRWDRNYNWVLQSWSGPNSPYRKERAEIDNSIKSGADPVSLVEKYQAPALADPVDPKAAFAFAYAYYQARLRDPKGVALMHFQAGKEPAFLEDNATNANTFDYARLKFLEGALQFNYPELIVAGYRLYVHNPKDAEVELALAKISDVYHPGPIRNLGLFLAKDLIAQNPENPTARRILSDDYFTIWQASHSQADAAHAIEAERERLAVVHATPAQIAANLRIDQIKHYAPGQSFLILSPLTLEWYERAVVKNPQDWDSWLQIMGNYYEHWRMTRSTTDANACLDAIQHILDYGPKDDQFQSGLKATIAEVKSGVPRVFKKVSKTN
jgi:hypothetical protein